MHRILMQQLCLRNLSVPASNICHDRRPNAAGGGRVRHERVHPHTGSRPAAGGTDPLQPPRGTPPAPSAGFNAKSALRISSSLISIAVGFWRVSAALALNSTSTVLDPRFAWLGFLLGLAALCSGIAERSAA